MLTPSQMRAVLAAVEYRPGWTFEVLEDHPEGPRLRIVGPVENSYRRGETTDLGINTFIPPCEDERAFLNFLVWRCRRIEIHESNEWLRRHGVPIFDPHVEI